LVSPAKKSPFKPDELLTLYFCFKNKGTLSARNVSAMISHSLLLKADTVGTDQIQTVSPTFHDNMLVTFVRPINPQMDANCFLGMRLGDPMFIHDGMSVTIKVSFEDAPATFWTRRVSFQEVEKIGPRLEFKQVLDGESGDKESIRA
jgi:hypothetical protein